MQNDIDLGLQLWRSHGGHQDAGDPAKRAYPGPRAQGETVLFHLISNRDRVVTKNELIEVVWESALVTDSSLTRVIAQLRKQLGDDAHHPRYIGTETTAGYRFIGDLEVAAPEVHEPNTPGLRAWPVVVVGTALVLLVALTAVWLVRRPAKNSTPHLVRLRQLTASGASDMFPWFSPDAGQIAFSSNRTGQFELYLRSLAPGSSERQITFDNRGAIEPAWSPDGRFLAYSFVDGGIAAIPISDGPVRFLADAGSDPDWSPDTRSLIYAPRNGTVPGADMVVNPRTAGS